ncbi:RNase P/MRP, p29 subunit [Ramicandelaber brevisporus]|nr:RNase P/MRP, p29 subunit [Ramicandelaber brevisporus]
MASSGKKDDLVKRVYEPLSNAARRHLLADTALTAADASSSTSSSSSSAIPANLINIDQGAGGMNLIETIMVDALTEPHHPQLSATNVKASRDPMTTDIAKRSIDSQLRDRPVLLDVPLRTRAEKEEASQKKKRMKPVQDVKSSVFEAEERDREREERRLRKSQLSRKTITAKERRSKGIHDIAKQAQQYALFEPLHELWMQYFSEVVNDVDVKAVHANSIGPKLLKADLHGCKMRVDRSKCANLVGIEGIMIKETKNAFNVISVDNRVRLVPKAGTVVSMPYKGVRIELYGDQMLCRASERAIRKFKPKPTADLTARGDRMPRLPRKQ